jgi:hypothetical protein
MARNKHVFTAQQGGAKRVPRNLVSRELPLPHGNLLYSLGGEESSWKYGGANTKE